MEKQSIPSFGPMTEFQFVLALFRIMSELSMIHIRASRSDSEKVRKAALRLLDVDIALLKAQEDF